MPETARTLVGHLAPEGTAAQTSAPASSLAVPWQRGPSPCQEIETMLVSNSGAKCLRKASVRFCFQIPVPNEEPRSWPEDSCTSHSNKLKPFHTLQSAMDPTTQFCDPVIMPVGAYGGKQSLRSQAQHWYFLHFNGNTLEIQVSLFKTVMYLLLLLVLYILLKHTARYQSPKFSEPRPESQEHYYQLG